MTRVTSAWQSRPFRRVWGAGAFSSLGAEIGELAIPVLALVTLGASATELSFVRAALLAPYLLLTLWLGVLVDRSRRRPLMIGADVARGLLLLAVCALALTDNLTVPLLVVAAALIGSLTVLYSLADFAFLPLVIDRHSLIDANAKITATQSAIGVGGAGAGGLLVQVLTAPLALVLNAIGYLVSGLLISRVHVAESTREPRQRASAFFEAREGLRMLLRHRVLRALVSEAGIWNLGNEVLTIALAVLVLRVFDYGALALGLLFMAVGTGALLGSLWSRALTARFGYGRSLLAALIIGNSAPLAGILFVSAPTWQGMYLLAGSFIVSGVGIGVANSQSVSLRQLATTAELRGRVNAGYRLVSWGALSAGALLGGVLVTALGAWPAAVAGATVMALATLPVAFSPARRLRVLSEIEPAAAAG